MRISLRCLFILIACIVAQCALAQSDLPQLMLIDADHVVDHSVAKQLYNKNISSFTTDLNFSDNREKILFTEEKLVCSKLIYSSDLFRNPQFFDQKIYRSVKTTSSPGSYDLIVNHQDITVIHRDDDLINTSWKTDNASKLRSIVHKATSQIPSDVKICQVSDNTEIIPKPINGPKILKGNQPVVDLPISIEIDYDLYLLMNQDIPTLMSWVNGVFSQVIDIYALENINLILEEIFIWDNPDPYLTSSKIATVLKKFGLENQNDFVGKATLLLSSRSLGGGIANIDKLCQPYDPTDYSGPYAVISDLNSSIGSGMNYNQNTYLIAHELSHILGSRHTHACVWGSENNQAIDNCWSTEGDCNTGQTPTNGGTMMSYCHLYSSVGVNFNLGFGDEPGALIYQRVSDTISCGAPECAAGDLCDDDNICTENDVYDENCECQGVLIDHNQNDICDIIENCPDIVLADTLNTNYSSAQNLILASKAYDQTSSVVFNSGQEILLNPGFEIKAGATFQTVSDGCGNN